MEQPVMKKRKSAYSDLYSQILDAGNTNHPVTTAFNESIKVTTTKSAELDGWAAAQYLFEISQEVANEGSAQYQTPVGCGSVCTKNYI